MRSATVTMSEHTHSTDLGQAPRAQPLRSDARRRLRRPCAYFESTRRSTASASSSSPSSAAPASSSTSPRRSSSRRRASRTRSRRRAPGRRERPWPLIGLGLVGVASRPGSRGRRSGRTATPGSCSSSSAPRSSGSRAQGARAAPPTRARSRRRTRGGSRRLFKGLAIAFATLVALSSSRPRLRGDFHVHLGHGVGDRNYVVAARASSEPRTGSGSASCALDLRDGASRRGDASKRGSTSASCASSSRRAWRCASKGDAQVGHVDDPRQRERRSQRRRESSERGARARPRRARRRRRSAGRPRRTMSADAASLLHDER